jgi:hypothetical protein
VAFIRHVACRNGRKMDIRNDYITFHTLNMEYMLIGWSSSQCSVSTTLEFNISVPMY